MEYKRLVDGVEIPTLGLGTWHMGGGFRPDSSQDRKYIEAIKYALAKGISHFDTAEFYGHGHTEEILGRAIKVHDRSKLFITSKISPHHLTYAGVKAACQRSLTRLGTDYLDLYLIHWPSPVARMKKVMQAFDELVDTGKIRYFGVSNFSLHQMVEAQALARHPIVTNQVHYSLLQSASSDLLDYAKRQQRLITAYSPLEQGRLVAGDYPQLDEIAQKYGKSRMQVALRWLLDQPQVITIPKASSPAHIDEDLGSLGWKLTPEDSQQLEQAFV